MTFILEMSVLGQMMKVKYLSASYRPGLVPYVINKKKTPYFHTPEGVNLSLYSQIVLSCSWKIGMHASSLGILSGVFNTIYRYGTHDTNGL